MAGASLGGASLRGTPIPADCDTWLSAGGEAGTGAMPSTGMLLPGVAGVRSDCAADGRACKGCKGLSIILAGVAVLASAVFAGCAVVEASAGCCTARLP